MMNCFYQNNTAQQPPVVADEVNIIQLKNRNFEFSLQNKIEKEMKELRDKFKDLQARHTEAKSQLDITKQELKKTQKVKLIKFNR